MKVEGKTSLVQSNFKIHSGNLYLLLRFKNNLLLLVAPPSGLHLQSHPLFSGKVEHVCSWLVLSACFLPVAFWWCNTLLSFCTLSLFPIQAGSFSADIKFSRTLWVSHVCHENQFTVMHHLVMGICSEKCILRKFFHCENIMEYTCTKLDGIAYHTLRYMVLILWDHHICSPSLIKMSVMWCMTVLNKRPLHTFFLSIIPFLFLASLERAKGIYESNT